MHTYSHMETHTHIQFHMGSWVSEQFWAISQPHTILSNSLALDSQVENDQTEYATG